MTVRHAAVAAFYASRMAAAYPSTPDDDTDGLVSVLDNLHVDSWVAGALAAAAGVGGAAIQANLSQVDLGAPSDWAPGWAETATLPDDLPSGLSALLDGNADLASNIVGYQADATRSVEDQSTQMTDTQAATGAEAGAQGSYAAAGFDQWNWVEDDNPCDDCQDAADGGPYGSDDDGPPLHPGCDCSTEPVDDQGSAEGRSMYDKEVRAKYSADDMKDLLANGKAMKNDNGDPSYPVADEEDIKKAVKAVGRGGADHNAIRAHIIKGAQALKLTDLIPDTWNADGSLKEEKARWMAPQSREARAEDSMSFGDIQSAVYEALIGTLPGRADVWIVDLGSNWVVYQDYWMDGLYKVSYSMDAANLVAFEGDPARVDQVTSFVPVELKSASRTGVTRADEADDVCSRCNGDKTVELNGNTVECPQCNGDGDSSGNAAETKGRRVRRRQRRDLPRHNERRLFTTTIEMRGQMEGDEAVLRGTPIVFNTSYSVRDWQGPFIERMKPTVIDDVLERGDLDCRFLENHDGRPMARTTNGTLTLSRGRAGVEAEARVDVRRSDSHDLALAIERQDVTQMSCGFIVADDGDEWRLADDGTEERDIHSFGELFDVSAVTYPASPTTSIELAQRMLAGVGDETRERLRKLYHVAKDIREGKMLSQQNGAELMAALEALHEADDVDIPGIVRSLQTIDGALDAGMAGISGVLGRANPDGDPGDLEPALVPPDVEEKTRAMQRQRLTVIRTRELLAV